MPSAATENDESSGEDIIEQSSAGQPYLILVRRRTLLHFYDDVYSFIRWSKRFWFA